MEPEAASQNDSSVRHVPAEFVARRSFGRDAVSGSRQSFTLENERPSDGSGSRAGQRAVVGRKPRSDDGGSPDRTHSGADRAASQSVFPAGQGTANDVSQFVRWSEGQRVLPAEIDGRAAAGSGHVQQPDRGRAGRTNRPGIRIPDGRRLCRRGVRARAVSRAVGDRAGRMRAVSQ